MENTTDKINVLYVDDEEANLRIFYHSFRREFNIFTATSAKDGLKILSEQKIDIVITDQKMPKMTGVEFLKEVNDKYPQLPPHRMIVSGYAQDEKIEEAYNHYRLFRFISKPWKTNELKELLIKCIDEEI